MIRAEPCFKCGARASCKHREVEDVVLPTYTREFDGRSYSGHSPWGAHGNPSGKARARIIAMMKAQLAPLART